MLPGGPGRLGRRATRTCHADHLRNLLGLVVGPFVSAKNEKPIIGRIHAESYLLTSLLDCRQWETLYYRLLYEARWKIVRTQNPGGTAPHGHSTRRGGRRQAQCHRSE